jgi:hypothetical protein
MAAVPISTPYTKLKAELDGIEADVAKADKGNHAAGVRVRKAMQSIKTQAQDIRLALVADK